MNMKNPFKRKKSPYKITDKVRVRKSYYTFSEAYPADRFQINRRKKIQSKRRKMNLAFSLVAFVILVVASFFLMSVSLNISNAPIDSPSAETEVDTSAIEKLKESGVKALYMPAGRLSDKEYVKGFVREVQKKNGNSVVIDFKSASGKLYYTSFQDYAILGRCNMFDNDTVRKSIDIFINNDITVIARIFCFEDPAVSEAFPDIAVKYLDTDVNWRDTQKESSGGWLNPVSKRAKNYLYGIVEELYHMNVRGFMLESVQFPDGAKSGATYPGEKESAKRNELLKSFVSTVRKKLPKDALLIVSQSAENASKGNESIYFGSMSDIDSDAIAADTRIRSEEIVLDKRERFSSLISLYGEISGRFPEKTVIPIIHMEEYSKYYLYTMRKSGYNSFVLIDESGNY